MINKLMLRDETYLQFNPIRIKFMFVFVGDLKVVIDDDKKVSFSAIRTEFQNYFTKYLEQRTIGGLRGPWFKERHQKPRPYREGIESRVWDLALDTLLIKVDTINFLHRSEFFFNLFFFTMKRMTCVRLKIKYSQKY